MRRPFALAAVLLVGAAPAPPPRIERIVPVVLHSGINRIPRFLPDGGAATIVEAWRGNGNAHGYHVWTVLTGPSEGNPVGIAPHATDDPGRYADTITDNPFDGERVLGTVRFARATVDGKAASLLFTADLDETERPFADHELATVTIYRLIAQEDGIGPPLAFERIASLRSTKRYCNAEIALHDLARVPLPSDFAGANVGDGCYPA